MSSLVWVAKGAVIAGIYRYNLSREWREEGKTNGFNWISNTPLVFIMLNPSTADAEVDDPTIRRCVSFAKRLKYQRLEVVNLFAMRATLPLVLKAFAGDPIGPDNSKHVTEAAEAAGHIICAWGTNGGYMDQDKNVLGWIKEHQRKTFCLGLTKNGSPKHPLYIKADAPLIPFNR